MVPFIKDHQNQLRAYLHLLSQLLATLVVYLYLTINDPLDYGLHNSHDKESRRHGICHPPPAITVSSPLSKALGTWWAVRKQVLNSVVEFWGVTDPS